MFVCDSRCYARYMLTTHATFWLPLSHRGDFSLPNYCHTLAEASVCEYRRIVDGRVDAEGCECKGDPDVLCIADKDAGLPQ